MAKKTIKVQCEKRTYHFLKSQCKELDRLEKEWNKETGPGWFDVSNVDIARIAISAGIEAIKRAMAIPEEGKRDYEMRELWLIGLGKSQK